MFLVIFGGLQHGQTLDVRNHLSFIDFYTPGIMAYAVLLICFNSTALIFATLRTDGTLKRVRTTPLPWLAYVAGAVGRRRSCSRCRSSCCSRSASPCSGRTCPVRR